MKKNELWFAITWIIIYVVVMGNLRGNLGDESPFATLALFIISAVLTIFIVKNGLTEKYGFVRVSDAKRYLYYIPFVLLCSVNLWFGISMHYEMPYQIFAVVTMALVGYVNRRLEEIKSFAFNGCRKLKSADGVMIFYSIGFIFKHEAGDTPRFLTGSIFSIGLLIISFCIF